MSFKITTTSISPSHLKTAQIVEELADFAKVVDDSYNLNIKELSFCFGVNYTDGVYVESDEFYKKDKWLGLNLSFSMSELEKRKNSIFAQRLYFGNHFYRYFTEFVHKRQEIIFGKKKNRSNDLVLDMQRYLTNNIWLYDQEGKVSVKNILKWSPDQAIRKLGNPRQREFLDLVNGSKKQTLIWNLSNGQTISVSYLLSNGKWHTED